MTCTSACVSPKGGKNKLCNKITHMKGALNANINVCTVISLKMLRIIEIDNKFHLNQINLLLKIHVLNWPWWASGLSCCSNSRKKGKVSDTNTLVDS